MKIVCEGSLDVDQNRKLWFSSIANGVEVDEVEEVVGSMAGALATQLVQAESVIKPGLEGKRDEKPKMPATFQEDDDPVPE